MPPSNAHQLTPRSSNLISTPSAPAPWLLPPSPSLCSPHTRVAAVRQPLSPPHRPAPLAHDIEGPRPSRACRIPLPQPRPPRSCTMASDAYCAGSSRESSPLSSPPSSPCPPSDYGFPSPPPSQDPSTKGSPLPDAMEPARSCDDDGPPRKKRRTAEPKPRVTRYLNLHEDIIDDTERDALDLLLKVLHKKRKIVMIVGAGISVAAGSKSPSSPRRVEHRIESLQSPTSAPPRAFSTRSSSSTISNPLARTCSTLLYTGIPTPLRRFTKWSGR